MGGSGGYDSHMMIVMVDVGFAGGCGSYGSQDDGRWPWVWWL